MAGAGVTMMASAHSGIEHIGRVMADLQYGWRSANIFH
jgi:hypothetical protein